MEKSYLLPKEADPEQNQRRGQELRMASGSLKSEDILDSFFFPDISSYFLLFQKPHFFRFSENGVLEKITFSFLAPPPDLTSELGLSSNNFLGALPSSWEHLAAHPPPPLTCLRSSDRSICFQSGSNKTFGSEESRGLVW